MRKISFLLVLAVIVASCGQDFKKGQKGLEYKLISEGKGSALKIGDLMQMHISNYFNDGMMSTDGGADRTRAVLGVY